VLHLDLGMTLYLDQVQVEALREILTSRLVQLRFEIAHADNRAFKAELHERERMVEELFAKLDDDARSSIH
jgi:thioredoxin-related protein